MTHEIGDQTLCFIREVQVEYSPGGLFISLAWQEIDTGLRSDETHRYAVPEEVGMFDAKRVQIDRYHSRAELAPLSVLKSREPIAV